MVSLVRAATRFERGVGEPVGRWAEFSEDYFAESRAERCLTKSISRW